MGRIKIIYTEFAQRCIEEIKAYYIKEAGVKIASKVIKAILSKANTLKNYPNIGTIEPSNSEFKFIVIFEYKIIFKRIDDVFIIADIFHCAQNPNKIGDEDRHL
jgi:toxin ParE1/3/4